MKEDNSAIYSLFKTALFIVLALIALSQWVSIQVDTQKQEAYEQTVREITPSDEGREVDSWDWDNNGYIYKDQLPERKPYIDKPKQGEPDMYVKVLGATSSPESSLTTGTRVTINNKSYTIRKRINGDIEFELNE